MRTFRLLASMVTVIGICLLILVFFEWHRGELAPRYFPGIEHGESHHAKALLLALPIPLHVIFIGLIIQKQWLPLLWRRVAWVGITGSGMWLGASILWKMV